MLEGNQASQNSSGLVEMYAFNESISHPLQQNSRDDQETASRGRRFWKCPRFVDVMCPLLCEAISAHCSRMVTSCPGMTLSWRPSELVALSVAGT